MDSSVRSVFCQYVSLFIADSNLSCMILGPIQYLNCEFLSRDLSKCYGAPIVMSLPYFMEAPDFLRYLYHYSFMQKEYFLFILDYIMILVLESIMNI